MVNPHVTVTTNNDISSLTQICFALVSGGERNLRGKICPPSAASLMCLWQALPPMGIAILQRYCHCATHAANSLISGIGTCICLANIAFLTGELYAVQQCSFGC